MQTLLTHYHLEAEPFLGMLAKPSVLLTGSAALALYLQENGKEPGFIPNDIDLYIAVPHVVQHGSFISFLHNADLGILFRYLLSRGYNAMGNDENGHDEVKEYDQDQRHEIACSITLRRNHCNIQLIALRIQNLVEYVCSRTDLSPCASWWDYASQRCENAYPEQTLQRIMKRINYTTEHIHSRREERLQKYLSRGFVLEEMPHAIECIDNRIHVDALEGCSAYDVIGLEDVDAAIWLRASPWNILIRVIDSFHAFDRRVLFNCMQQKETTIPYYATVYETPHHQSVTEEAMELLMYADWSIYELVHEHTITYGFANDRQKSVYRIQCSSIDQYLQGEIGIIVTPPPMQSVVEEKDPDDLPPLLLIREHHMSSSDDSEEEGEESEEERLAAAIDRNMIVARWRNNRQHPSN